MDFEGYNLPNFFIKFGSLENLMKLKNGEVYMKDFNYYRTVERKGMGDNLDGSIIINQDIYIEGYPFPGTVEQVPNPKVKIPIFCATWINSKNAKIIETNDSITVRISIDIDKFKEGFGCEYGMIISYEEFNGKIQKIARNDNVTIDNGLVKYYDFTDRTNPWFNDSVNKDFDRFYCKELFFQYQNEIRWVYGKNIGEEKDYKILKIEPLYYALICPLKKFTECDITFLKKVNTL